MLVSRLATELGIAPAQVEKTMALMDAGDSVPFIARYRKEATGGLDDVVLREFEVRLQYWRNLDARRETIVKSLTERGLLTSELKAHLNAAQTLQVLEDHYAPFKPKRRNKAQIAMEAGLGVLADALWADPTLDPAVEAQSHVQPETEQANFSTVILVLDGVRDILSERFAEDALLREALREWWWKHGCLQAARATGQAGLAAEALKFQDYFEYSESLASVPSHRALAVFRGRSLDILDVKLALPAHLAESVVHPAEDLIAQHLGFKAVQRAADEFLSQCIRWAWRVKLSLSIERELFTRLRETAESLAIKIFADNLRDLLLAAPATGKVIMGLDPGIRTGVKLAIVDATGKLLHTDTLYPHEPRCDWQGSLDKASKLCAHFGVELVAIGNGTASRPTERLVRDLIKLIPKLERMVVSEAGASVYSASELASKEMPDIDVSLRGAVSIARRLQDPLAELVKIDPKAIGVGQYQHDVNPSALTRALSAVVEDCVNAVGVDLNTASAPLLTRVSGLSASLAQALVSWRETHGAFRTREALKQVPGIGAKTFEQSAGFLRIREGDNPLDNTGVHPESYAVVENLLAKISRNLKDVIGQSEAAPILKKVSAKDLGCGEATYFDILKELEKPGRDPRGHFEVVRFMDGIEAIGDLKEGMVLEGVVSNVAAFGAFVDLGVHQDGLIHVSELADRFVEDARTVVKTGERIKVRVIQVDLQRNRIALSLKLKDTGARPAAAPKAAVGAHKLRATQPTGREPTAMELAFAQSRR